MERFLLIRNKNFFDKHNIYTINSATDIPNKNAILFMGSHANGTDSSTCIDTYRKLLEGKPYTYIIIAGKGDGIIPSNVTIPKNIKLIYATHTNYIHPVIKFIPLGSDFRSINSFSKGNICNNNRKILCYCNYSLDTHPCRITLYKILKNKEFITIENMNTWLNYSITRDAFFENLGNSKFVICVRGYNIDSFRFYDAIYSGAIPIVVKEPFHDANFFKNVPILFLNSINDFNTLTKEFLENEYKTLSKLKKTYYKELDFNNFITNIKKKLENYTK